MTYTLFGIPNCDTMKKARNWLDENGVVYNFHNYKTEGITNHQIENWIKHVPLNRVLNKASSTYRKLTDEEKSSIDNEATAIVLMVANPSMIKRPVLMRNDTVVAVGFKPEEYKTLF